MDLSLAVQVRRGSKLAYTLSDRGVRLQNTLNSDPALAMDILHYLHYTRKQCRGVSCRVVDPRENKRSGHSSPRS